MKEIINTIISDSIEKLKANLSSEIDIKSIPIDQKFFDEKYMKSVNITKELSEFNKLLKINQPVLYWFEFDTTKVSKEVLRAKYESYRNKFVKDYNHKEYRNTAAVKKDYRECTNILYVGKVKNGFWGRLVTHLGYNISVKTAGMQLFHWFEPIKYGDLRLNYWVLNDDMNNLIALLEIELAQQLNPLIGKY